MLSLSLSLPKFIDYWCTKHCYHMLSLSLQYVGKILTIIVMIMIIVILFTIDVATGVVVIIISIIISTIFTAIR